MLSIEQGSKGFYFQTLNDLANIPTQDLSQSDTLSHATEKAFSHDRLTVYSCLVYITIFHFTNGYKITIKMSLPMDLIAYFVYL